MLGGGKNAHVSKHPRIDDDTTSDIKYNEKKRKMVKKHQR